MSFTNPHILPLLYDGLATRPLSPVGSPKSNISRLLITPRHSVSNTPLVLSPVASRRNSPPSPSTSNSSALTTATTPSITAAASILDGLDSAHSDGHRKSIPNGNAHLNGPSLLSLGCPNRRSRNNGLSSRRPSLVRILTDPDSLTRQRKGEIPSLGHLLSVGNGRVICLAADDKFVYAGCQSRDNEIVLFSRNSLQPMFRLLGHAGSVLALLIVPSRNWLVSSSGAGDIRIWSTSTLQPLYTIHPCDDTSGDIYSLAWDDRNGGVLYFGAQDTSIGWVYFSEGQPTASRRPSTASNDHLSLSGSEKTDSTPARPANERSGRSKPHPFFNLPPPGSHTGASTPQPGSAQPIGRKEYFNASDVARHLLSSSSSSSKVVDFEVDVESTLFAAHFGYVYAMAVVHRPDGKVWLVSGSGDSDVKIWDCAVGGGLQLVREFQGLSGAVLSFAVRDSLLYAGLQDGEIVVWDLETAATIRKIDAHESDVMTMTVLGSDVYTASADGLVLRMDAAFDCTAAFKAHSGTVLSATVVPAVPASHGWELITAGNDSFVKIWNVDPPVSPGHAEVDVASESDVMLYALSKLVAVPTVSDEAHREDCRQGAHLLKKLLGQLGAKSEVLSGEEGRNPLILATFSGQDTGKPRKRVLFYGHYDVQPAEEVDWETNPWELSGRNGYLYGRGVTDNKGPILAVACAAASLRQRRELDVDLVMLIEGEEEAGSRGFSSCVQQHKEDIGHIDVILLSNSTWINEEDACVVYGMRGVVYANLTISSAGDDAHNGVEGGVVAEAMLDMVRLLGALSDGKTVNIPGFYNDVRSPSDEEMKLLEEVARASGRSLDELVRVWRQPSFSIANITTSGAANKTVIPRRVSADISMRIVPDQELDKIVAALKSYCQETFAKLSSPNSFEITVTHTASWWLASLDSPYFRALEHAVQDIWGQLPLKIREGGTVPTVFWLERELKAPCVHLPLGQASDAGHLANERMRLLNLRNGKRVVERYLTRLAEI